MPRQVKTSADGLQFFDDDGNKVTVNASASLSSDTQLTLPSSSGTLALTSDVVGFANPMTTAGDLILGGASGTPERLAIGTNRQTLVSNGTTIEWSNHPTTAIVATAVDISTPAIGVVSPLSIDVAANKTYRVTGTILIDPGAGERVVTWAYAVPSGATMNGWERIETAPQETAHDIDSNYESSSIYVANAAGSERDNDVFTNKNRHVITLSMLLTTTSSGSLQFTAGASGADAQVMPGSGWQIDPLN